MGLDQDDTEGGVGILTSVFVIPTSQAYLSPAWMFQFGRCIRLSPGLWFLESKAFAVHKRTTTAAVHAGSAIQDAVVAVLSIGYDEVTSVCWLSARLMETGNPTPNCYRLQAPRPAPSRDIRPRLTHRRPQGWG